jgi:hypothetical protein
VHDRDANPQSSLVPSAERSNPSGYAASY